jgi:hypothetical protein
MNAFEAVTIVVAVVAIVVAVASYLRVNRAIDQLGHGGRMWFDHAADQPIEGRPNEDERDEPIPKRPLRGRPE